MEKPTSYCAAIKRMEPGNVHIAYHDEEYGFPLKSDDELFERLILEINQAGLSWTTILNKKKNFHKAYNGFSIKRVAAYKQKDRNRLLNDAGIIRNKLKVNAAIENAKVILELQNEFGSFSNWLDHHHPLKKEVWVKLFKKHFKFTGGEIVNEFLMSTGYLKGAHIKTCPIYEKTLKKRPMWAKQDGKLKTQ